MYEILLNPHNISENKYNSYRIRNAARGIVKNTKEEIASVYVGKYDYYKLPGGGMDEGESPEETMARECIEELGYSVKNIVKLPLIITEIKAEFKTKQTSYILSCEADEVKETGNLSEYEKSLNFEIRWNDYSDTLKAFAENEPTGGEDSHYITVRDTAIVSLCHKLQLF